MKIVRPRLSIGDVLIDRYTILDEIGQGGMQQVYLADDAALGRRVALKVPIDASAQKRFERSARLSANIVHPNIAKTLDYVSDDGFEFLVEEFIMGSDLQARIDREFKSVDPHLAAHLVHHIAKAVAAMNGKGIIHRDLKPSNVMVSDDPGLLDVKVTDFGVATMASLEIKNAVQGGQGSIAASKTVVGALAFMAPELIKREDGADRSKCDAWSLGALMYYLLFGEYPFGSELAAIQNILNGTLKDRTAEILASKLQFRNLMTSLWEVIRRCLTMNVSDRPTSHEVADMLSKIAYQNAPRRIGTVGYVNPGPGAWAFILPDDGGENVFFHFDSFFGGKPVGGLRVSFADFPGSPQSRAHPVVPFGK